MIDAAAVLVWSVNAGLFLLSIALLLCVVRVIIGPTLPDRVLGLDMLVAVAIGYIALIGIKTGFSLYVDIAIALGLVGFLATVAFSRFILESAKRGKPALDEREAMRHGDDIPAPESELAGSGKEGAR